MAELRTPEERDLLAAELALGVLEGEDRAEALRLKLSDPAFAAEVAAWGTRLGPMSAGFAETPVPGLWPAIERHLDGAVPSLRQLRFWRFGTIGAGALAASLAAVLVLRPPETVEIVRAPEQSVIAQLQGAGDSALLAANYDPAQGVLKIRAVHLPQSALAPELWIIPADGKPRSLGLVSATGLSRVGLAADRRALMEEGVTLAITMEPRDGAPHMAPSSAPIAAGKISTI